MIEPEIAFADLSDNAALAEALLKYPFAAGVGRMQSAVLFARMPGPDRKIACLAYPTSGIPMEAKIADYIHPTFAAA